MRYLILISIYLFSFSQVKIEPTPEWIYSDANTLFKTASITWTSDIKALIYDQRITSQERSIELFDPASGKRETIVDAKKAVASLKKIHNHAADFLPEPDSYTSAGDKGLYEINGDLFVLTFSSSSFQRLTATEETEKSPSFSPDGNRVAFVRNNDLYVFDLKKNTEIRITESGGESLLNGTLSWVYWEEIFGRRDIGYWWSPDSKSIAFLESDESLVDLIYYVDFKPNVQRVFTQRYPKAGHTNPSVRIGINRVGSKSINWIDKNKFDYEYIIRVNWLPDNQRISVQTMNRKQDEVKLFFVKTDDLSASLIHTETDPGWINIHDDLHFLNDGKHFIWASERTGYAHLYLYKMNGDLVRQITTGNWAVASSGAGQYWVRQSVSAIDEEKQLLYFTAMEKSSIERHLYKINLEGKGMERLTLEAGRHAISFSPDAHYYYDQYSRIDRSPEIAFFKADGSRIITVSPAQLDLQKQLDLQYPELFTISAKDGFKLPVQLLKPKDFDKNRKYGLIIKVYGGPSAPSVSNQFQFENLYNQNLLKNGFLVMSIDNRGSTAISKTLENRYKEGAIAEMELPDVIDAVHYMKSQSYIDPKRVGIWGWSGGGTFTLAAMTHSDEFAAGICGAPNTNGLFYDSKWMEMYIKDDKRMAASDLVKTAKNLNGKILFIHGTADDNVHIQHTYAVVDELIKAGKLYEMMIYPMRKHGFTDRPALIHRYNVMIDFWKRNL